MNERFLFRMAKLAHRPPSWKRVVLLISVIVICLVLAGVEWLVGWPDWATVGRMRPPRDLGS